MVYYLDYEFRIILPKSFVFKQKNKRMPKKQPISAGYGKLQIIIHFNTWQWIRNVKERRNAM